MLGFRTSFSGERRHEAARVPIAVARSRGYRANWPPIGHRTGSKAARFQANYEYRYRDSNPGFRP